MREAVNAVVGHATIEYWSEDQGAARISFANDLLAPFLLFIFVTNERLAKHLSKRVFSTFLLATILSGALSFTRLIWVILAIILFIFIIKNLKSKSTYALLLVMVTLGTFSFIKSDGILDVAQIRLGDSNSLLIKVEQAKPLLTAFMESPILGNGLGFYSKEVIRSQYLPYIYETQWIAILAQTGIIGVTFILFYLKLAIAPSFKNILRNPLTPLPAITWLIASFTNPYLFILTFSPLYFAFYISKESLSIKPNKNPQ